MVFKHPCHQFSCQKDARDSMDVNDVRIENHGKVTSLWCGFFNQQPPPQRRCPQTRRTAQQQPTSALLPRRPHLRLYQTHPMPAVQEGQQPPPRPPNEDNQNVEMTRQRGNDSTTWKRQNNAQATQQCANDTTCRKRPPVPTKTTHDHDWPRWGTRTHPTDATPPPSAASNAQELKNARRQDRTTAMNNNNNNGRQRRWMDDDGEATSTPTSTSPSLTARLSLPLLLTTPSPSLTSHHSLPLSYSSPLPPLPLFSPLPPPSLLPPLLFTTLPPLSLISYHFPLPRWFLTTPPPPLPLITLPGQSAHAWLYHNNRNGCLSYGW